MMLDKKCKSFPVRIGIDEFGTGQSCNGWTYFCIPETYQRDFECKAKSILKKTKLNAFHGKEFKRKYISEYRDFLELILEHIKKSLQCKAINTLFAENFKKKFDLFCKKLVYDSFEIAGVKDDRLPQIMETYAPPLFTLARLHQELGPNVDMRLEIDYHDNYGDLAVKIGNSSLEAILRRFYNKYVELQFCNTPKLSSKDSIAIVGDEESFLVQSADLIANFSKAYIFSKLGRASKTNEAKSELFEQVFGDLINNWPLGDFALDGDNLVFPDLYECGEIKLSIGYVVTKGPDKEWLEKNKKKQN